MIKIRPKLATSVPVTVLTVVTLAICVPLFMRIGLLFDLRSHLRLIIQGAQNKGWPSYFFYHYLVYLLSFRSTDYKLLSNASVVVLTASEVAKVCLSYWIIHKTINIKFLAAVLSLSLLFVTPIMNWWNFPLLYIGQLTPNVWHNPTMIFAMPFVLLLFYVGIKALKMPNAKNILLVGVLITLNTLAKPNYVIAFLPTFFIFFLINTIKQKNPDIKKAILLISIILIPIFLILFIQFRITYGQHSESRIIILPFTIWKMYSPNLIASFLVSTAFPLVYTIFYFREAIQDNELKFAWTVFLVAVVQFILFAESGTRLIHGNFIWGSYMSLFVLFLLCLTKLFNKQRSWRFYTTTAIYALHLASGIYYFMRIVAFQSYF